MTLPTSKIYRPCVGITLFNSDGLVLVGERIDSPGAWQMPQGGIDDGENIETAAFRELQEETGTDKAQIIKQAQNALRYDIPENIINKLWNGKYAGQEQYWVALKFTGQDSDIQIDQNDRPEFQKWQWVKLEETIDLIVPFKRDVYAKVIEFFKDIPATLRNQI